MSEVSPDGPLGFFVQVEFTVQVTSEDRVNRSTMEVPDFSVVMIHRRMDMDQGNGERP